MAYNILAAPALMSAPGGWTGACSGDSSIMLENPSNVSLFILGLKFDKMYRRLAETRKKVVLKYGTAFEGSVVQHHGISTLALYLITNRTGLRP